MRGWSSGEESHDRLPCPGHRRFGRSPPVTYFGPDFPFAYDDWLRAPAGLGPCRPSRHGTEVAIVGAGAAGMVAAYELMKLGLKPVIYESVEHRRPAALAALRGCGRRRRRARAGCAFPVSSTAFFHYLDRLGLGQPALPQPAGRRRRPAR